MKIISKNTNNKKQREEPTPKANENANENSNPDSNPDPNPTPQEKESPPVQEVAPTDPAIEPTATKTGHRNVEIVPEIQNPLGQVVELESTNFDDAVKKGAWFIEFFAP